MAGQGATPGPCGAVAGLDRAAGSSARHRAVVGPAHRSLDADDALLHPPRLVDGSGWARKEAHELVLLAAYLADRDDAADFWDVLRVVIVEYLSAGIPAYFDWLIDRDKSTHEVVAAMRRLPVRDQVLLCLYDEDGRTSRHEEGRFRAADLALLFGIEPASVRVAARTGVNVSPRSGRPGDE